MVDSVSGNAASRSARPDLQLATGRDLVENRPGRLEVPGRVIPAGTGTSAPEAPDVVSRGREAARQMASEPPVDTRRVAELREAIAVGRYTVDPDRIADAMLQSEPGLLRG